MNNFKTVLSETLNSQSDWRLEKYLQYNDVKCQCWAETLLDLARQLLSFPDDDPALIRLSEILDWFPGEYIQNPTDNFLLWNLYMSRPLHTDARTWLSDFADALECEQSLVLA